ncbi:sigma-54 dependent transcriptional regulator [Altererythrobacter aquiaggeris]|uniref:sigma-54-dependent transcriptional regulator n=1 Tax=Aestuarierythrobacter aquiaggeris TaxID=1898396 RepID=UPI003017D2D9
MNALDAITVLLVEDDRALAEATVQALQLEGAIVTHFDRADTALAAIDRDFAGVVITDIRMPGMDGIAFFERLRSIDDAIPVILVTGHGDIDLAVDAMRVGAFDFLAKPFGSERLFDSIVKASANRTLVLENRVLRGRLERSNAIPGHSAASQRLRSQLALLAKADVDVVIEGEGGTGKSFAARLMHQVGPRSSRPIVVVDAGTVLHPDAEVLLFGRDQAGGLSHTGLSHTGLIERARGGTLVLDEIESVSGATRERLKSLVELRTLRPLGAERSRNVDIRIIQVLPQGVTFDRDCILHRGNPVRLTLPSISERDDDVAEFFSLFLARHEHEFGVEYEETETGVLHHIRTYDWPGNLRELDTYVKSLVIGSRISPNSRASRGTAQGLRDQVEGFERSIIEAALKQSNGNIAQAEKILSVPTKTLYDKLTRHHLKPKDYRT